MISEHILLLYLNRLSTFGRKQPSHRLKDAPQVNVNTSDATDPNEEIDNTEIEDMYPAPISNMTRLIVNSILPVLFIIFEIGFWSYNRSSHVDDLVYLHF